MTYVNTIDSEVSNAIFIRRAKKSQNESLDLDHLLSPLWSASYVTGVLPITYQQGRKHSRTKLFASYTGVTFTLLLLNCVVIFTLSQLIGTLKQEQSTIHAIIPLISWLCPGLIALFTQLYYLIRRRDVSQFFKDWRRLERALQIKSCVNRHLHSKVYWSLGFLTLASVSFVGYQVYAKPDEPFFISSYDIIVRAVTLGPIVAFHVYVMTIMWICVSLADCLPVFVFFSAALGVESLLREIQSSVDSKFEFPASEKRTNAKQLPDSKKYPPSFIASSMEHNVNCSVRNTRDAWRKFHSICEIVDRANYLFGIPLFVNQAVYIFLTCSLVYSILYHFQAAFNDEAITSLVTGYSANVIVIVVRFFFGSWIACHLAKSVSTFTSTLSFLIGENWSRLDGESRDYCLSFLDAVTKSNLAARPCDLYSITPSFFLTSLGIVLSYVIVLLQSK